MNKRKVKRFVEWGLVWELFDGWYQEQIRLPHCSKCGQARKGHLEWDEQQAKIEEIVESELQKKR